MSRTKIHETPVFTNEISTILHRIWGKQRIIQSLYEADGKEVVHLLMNAPNPKNITEIVCDTSISLGLIKKSGEGFIYAGSQRLSSCDRSLMS